ncbi:ABC transporter permease subunit [Arthrobacter sp. Sa2BUA2]|uniref:ABC transporter permease subunit n=1 Tax=Arthrobacter pullicola TaxID=2762224 RepID=A0ABR8YDI3_9MICC|nr:ABC transporter permease subunit [Arthrobacter pullicola]MBD8042192.1 ABC transporter permease subunit [Arthrobacter pullicola]
MSIAEASQRQDRLGYWKGISTVFALEMRQRVRSRGWYVLLGVWFVVIGLVAAFTAWLAGEATGAGETLFELMIGFVLFFGLLVAPALSANAVNGDRAAGTLAVLQVTLLRPGQLLAGKWLASWVASLGFLLASVPFLIWALALGGVRPGAAVVSLLMLGVELAIVCALGVGVSALANRPLFSIVVTYMLVALLSIGTLIAFALSMPLVKGTVQANFAQYERYQPYTAPDETFNDSYTCTGPLVEMEVNHTERSAWLLAVNPFVVVADAVPYDTRDVAGGPMESISQSVRYVQAGPEFSGPQCINGEVRQDRDLPASFPIWPLGLTVQLGGAALLLALARRRLVTPARRLASGTRIA